MTTAPETQSTADRRHRWVPLPVAAGGPGWWSGNAVVQQTVIDGVAVVRKTARAHTPLVAPVASTALRTAMGEQGLGPRIVIDDAEDGLISHDLTATCRVGTFTRLTEPLIGAILATHSAIGRLDISLRRVDPCVEVQRLLAALQRFSMPLPAGAEAVLRCLPAAATALGAGSIFEPTLGDATVSNVMIQDDQAVRLVGGTLEAEMDRAYIAGCLVAEFAPFFRRPEAVFEQFWGSWDPQQYARARLFSLIDDVRWMCISRLATFTNESGDFTPSPYGSLRLRHALGLVDDSEFTTWMRQA